MSSWPEMRTKDVEITYLELPPFRTARMSVEEYKDMLRKEGWSHVGEGVSSDVFAKGKYVIKVSVNDYGYDAFLEQALNRQDNPFFPKIYRVARFLARTVRSSSRAKVTLVMMERLEDKPLQAYTDSMKLDGRGHLTYKPHMDRTPLAGLSLHELDAAVALGKLYNKFEISDLHPGNVLYRGEQPVIIDPIIYRYEHGWYYHD